MTVSAYAVTNGVEEVLSAWWDIRDGRVVPETGDVTLKNGAVELDATYLYADMAGSSKLAQTAYKQVAAKIMRCYINAASRILNGYAGAIRSFDGDRVMAIFVGTNKNTDAVRAALALNWAVSQVINPKVRDKWPDLTQSWTISHGVGIDTGEALIVRGGVREHNDLISVGSAPNVAAKLSEQRGYSDIYITEAVHDDMAESVTLADDRRTNMWKRVGTTSVGGRSVPMFGSGYWWAP